MTSAEKMFKEAFDRLKSDNPMYVPKGTKVSQNNVAKEAGKHPTALKKDRFPLLILEIQDYIKQKSQSSEKLSLKKSRRKKRSVEERLKACQIQRDKLASICEAQQNMIEQLYAELHEYQNKSLS